MPGWARWVAAVAALLFAVSAMTVFYFRKADWRNATPVEVVPLTGMAGRENDPAFSPDGNQVAYTLSGLTPDRSGVYTTMIGGERPLRLTTNPQDCCPLWSPDARSVAFARTQPRGYAIYVLPALGGTAKKVYSEENEYQEHIGMSPKFSWSPDGKYLAISALSAREKRPTITLVSLQDSSTLPVTSPPPEYSDWCPSFSPDGKSIAFLRSSGPGLVDDVYVVPSIGGEPKRLTADRTEVDAALAWTADSREIIFSSGRGGLPSLWRIPASGGTARRVEGVGTLAFAPAIALTGNRLAYTNNLWRLNLWRVRLTDARHTAGPPQLIVASKAQSGLSSFSPDGRKLVFESTQSGYGEIWTADNDGSNPAQLTFLSGASGTPHWSYDGRSIAFDYRPGEHSEIYVVDVSGGSPRIVPTIPGADNTVPSWSRDGKWIYLASNRGNEANQIWKVPQPGGAPIQLTRRGGTFPIESVDGFVYYSRNYHSDEIWKVPAGGGEETLVMKGSGLDCWCNWTLGPAGIYFIAEKDGGKRTLFYYEFGTRKVLSLMLFEKYAINLSLSPDGKSLVFSQVDDTDQTIMLVNHFR